MHIVDANHMLHNELDDDMLYCSACHELCTHDYLCTCCGEEMHNGKTYNQEA